MTHRTRLAPGASVIDEPPAPRTRPGKPLRVLLADDHAVFRAGLRALLEREPDVVVVGEAGTGDEAVARAAVTRPNVIVMDLVMPGQGGLEATRRIGALGIGASVLVVTALAQEQQLLDALEAGATGYVEKAAPARDLIQAIRAVGAGRLFLDPNAAGLVVLQRYRRDGQPEDDKAAADRLSRRERQVLALLALGHTAREIGRQLAVTPETVEAYRARLMDRLGLRRRAELVRFALRTGLLQPQ